MCWYYIPDIYEKIYTNDEIKIKYRKSLYNVQTLQNLHKPDIFDYILLNN